MSNFFSNTDLSRKDAEGIISETLNKIENKKIHSIEDVLAIDEVSRNNANQLVKRYN